MQGSLSKQQRLQIKGLISALAILLLLLLMADRLLNDVQGEAPQETKDEQTNIRVLIKNSGFESIFHDCLELYGTQELCITYQKGEEWFEECVAPGELLTIACDSQYLLGAEHRLKISATAQTGKVYVRNLIRSAEPPGYAGELEIFRTDEGLVLINSLPLEEYLCWVIPSEMPAVYPFEALRAQAICARTYAYGCMLNPAYPAFNADLDDSTSFQVYHNLEVQENTTLAVKATSGTILLAPDGTPANTYYYATSCGYGTDLGAWNTDASGEEENISYLKGKKISREVKDPEWENSDEVQEGAFLKAADEQDYEVAEPWYRWSYEGQLTDPETFARKLKKVGAWNATPFREIYEISVDERGSGGVAQKLRIETDTGDILICGEHCIREVLCDGSSPAIRQDGSEVTCPQLLPSAFFLLETGKEGGNVIKYTLTGGGYGHGIGMSQNAAKEMAVSGKSAEEILQFFYEGCEQVCVSYSD